MPLANSPDTDGGAAQGRGLRLQDPSVLTIEQLLRENFWLRELLEGRIDAVTARIDESSKTIELLQAFADRTPTTRDVQHDVTTLREVMMRMFDNVNDRFSQGRMILTDALEAQEKRANATNENTATANAKMEAGFTKQFDSLILTVDSKFAALASQNQDLKERLATMEARTQGITQAKTETSLVTTRHHAQSANIAAIVFGALGLLIGLVTVANTLFGRNTPQQVVYDRPQTQTQQK